MGLRIGSASTPPQAAGSGTRIARRARRESGADACFRVPRTSMQSTRRAAKNASAARTTTAKFAPPPTRASASRASPAGSARCSWMGRATTGAQAAPTRHRVVLAAHVAPPVQLAMGRATPAASLATRRAATPSFMRASAFRTALMASLWTSAAPASRAMQRARPARRRVILWRALRALGGGVLRFCARGTAPPSAHPVSLARSRLAAARPASRDAWNAPAWASANCAPEGPSRWRVCARPCLRAPTTKLQSASCCKSRIRRRALHATDSWTRGFP